MPIISSSVLLPSTFSSVPSSVSQKNDDERGESPPEVTETMIAVSNSHNELFFQPGNILASETKKGLWHYLKNIFHWGRVNAAPEPESPEEIALNKILADGQEMRQQAENVIEQLQQADEIHPPAFSLKTKIGLFMGTTLVLAGSGIGMYIRRSPTTKNHEDFSSFNPISSTDAVTKKMI